MKRLEEAVRAFLAALGKAGQDCRADLRAVWGDFRADMAVLWQDLRRDGKTLWERCREMMGALAAEVRLTVHRWIG